MRSYRAKETRIEACDLVGRIDALDWPRVVVARRYSCIAGKAADVVADPRRRHVSLVRDATPDGLRVPRVMVGAEHAELGLTGLHASLELLQAPLVDGTEGLDLHLRSSSPLSF